MVIDVTNLVFSKDDDRLLTGDRHGRSFKREEIDHIQGFLKVLKKEIHRMGETENYESLYSLAQRISEFEVGKLKDASMVRFRDYVYRETASFWAYYKRAAVSGGQPFGAIASKACEYIEKCVRRLLDPLDAPKGLELIPSLIDKYGAGNVDVLTLNHDRLVEILLKSRGIPYTTGFDSQESNDRQVDFYDDTAFDDEKCVRIVKLHGCVSWWKFGKRMSDGNYLYDWGIVNDPEVHGWEAIDRDEEKFSCPTHEEPVTTGNTTKTEAYTRGITGEMYLQARRLLKEHDRIISSGYGFGDDGFNHMLAEWSRRMPKKKMLLLYNTSEVPLEQGCWFWPEDWKSNHSDGWFKHHPQWLSATSCSDVERLIF
ncbi:SIR2 family protein [Lentimonas sp. CC8]|nr:SIR2 family protein [Lentimonas sp. CC8]